MKTSITDLPKGRITRWGLLATLLIAVSASVGWMDREQSRLSGTWIGHDNAGFVWTCQGIPSDPDGKTAAVRVSAITYGATYPALLSGFGADTASDAVGEFKTISHNTANWTMVAYELKAGMAPEMKAIEVYSGTWEFTGPDSAVLNYTLRVYPPSPDGFPHGDPLVTIPDLMSLARRMPAP